MQHIWALCLWSCILDMDDPHIQAKMPRDAMGIASPTMTIQTTMQCIARKPTTLRHPPTLRKAKDMSTRTTPWAKIVQCGQLWPLVSPTVVPDASLATSSANGWSTAPPQLLIPAQSGQNSSLTTPSPSSSASCSNTSASHRCRANTPLKLWFGHSKQIY